MVIEVLPWQMECQVCQQHWEAELSAMDCACGSSEVIVHGSDELTLRWIEIDEVETLRPDPTGDAHESASRGERAEAQ